MKNSIIRYIQLPFHFDESIMKDEVEAITMTWKAHYNSRHYEGNWSGISLRTPGGAADNLLTESMGDDVPFQDTTLMDQCPYIRQVLDSLKCTQKSIRLLKLEKGAVIKEHTDTNLNFENGEVRLHIPVVTHNEVEFYLDSKRLQMKAGECWYINANLPHRLTNPSPIDRVHLVVDCEVNDWLKNLFLQSDLPVKSIKDISGETMKLQRLMINELKRSNTAQSLDMALEIERSLAADAPVGKMVDFIRSIGISVAFGELDDHCFVPGISIEDGGILIDQARLKYPGDLLHEAGHIAVVPEAERWNLNAEVVGKRKDNAAEEMMAMAWSYAAIVHLDMDGVIVFHPDGYKGGGENLLQCFDGNAPLGVPMLQYVGMTLDRKRAEDQHKAPYPAMLRWMRE